MKTLHILIGIQGSGNSTFCRRCLPGVERVNLDTLKTRKNESRMIADCLARGVSFVVDNSNPEKTDRARYIPAAKAAGYRVIGYFLQSDLADCLARNEKRTGKERVPVKGVIATRKKLQPPERAEGFDEIYFVSNDGREMTVSDWRDGDPF